MNQEQSLNGKSSTIFVASLAATAVVAYILGKFTVTQVFENENFDAFSIVLGLLSGLVLAYGIANFILKERLREKLLSDAITDPESGLYTRHYMNEIGPRFIAMHQRDPKAGFAVSLFELENPDKLLKLYGKRFVSTAYLSVATLVIENIRETDLAVAYGNGRVAIFSTCDGQEQAVKTLERIRRELQDWQVPLTDQQSVKLTVTAAQVIHQSDETLSELLTRAEQQILVSLSGE